MWKPRIDYGPEPVSWLAEIPTPAWEPIEDTIGDTRTAASGYSVAYELRKIRRLAVTLRFFEHEWPQVHAAIDYARRHPNTWTVYPDQSDTVTSDVVYLDSPMQGQSYRPTREQAPSLLSVFRLDIEIRLVDLEATFDVQYFAAG
jgi:hypothetical protein